MKILTSFPSLEKNPARLFWLLAGFHLVAWIVIPTLVNPNVLMDVVEGYAWGREWPLGTHKHPPLQAWLLEICAVLTGRAPWAHYVLNQISVLTAFWAVWQTGKRIVGEPGAVIGALLLAAVAYYNIITPAFNPNVLQLPFWALMGWSFHRAVKDNRILDWAALGLWSAGGLYAKYSTVLLMLVLGVLMFAHADSRKRLASPGPWLAVLVALLLFLPHFLWLADHQFMPFRYTGERFEEIPHVLAVLIAPGMFVIAQIAALLPAIILFGTVFWRSAKFKPAALRSFDGMFLSFVTFGPLLIACAIAAVGEVRIRNMWGTSFWNFAGLWAVFFFRPAFTPKTLRFFVQGWLLIFATGLAVFAAADGLGPYITQKAKRFHFPGRILAETVSQIWHERYQTPLRYVIGDVWVAGNVAYYAPDRPHVLIRANYDFSPWVRPEDIKRDGGVVVWCWGSCITDETSAKAPYIAKKFPTAEIQPPLVIPQLTAADVPPVRVHWAIVPPEKRD
ncbi:MAG: glycosyltransferase family 39 protein [Alphaproteobacteria bacterium]|nr:glycosyltransferase family 39 protein [Alphaproteobacteria bacterium]